RQKTMHPFEKFQVLNALAFKRAIGAAGVGNPLAGKSVPHPVRDARRRDANEGVSFPAGSDARAADAIELPERFEELWQLARVVLQIGVKRDQVFAARGFQSGPARRRLPAIERESLHAKSRIARRKLLQYLPRLVLAAIVGDHDFV